MHPAPHPDDAAQPHTRDIPGLPPEEQVDPSRVGEDLADDPTEKRNATDGYAPADETDLDDR